MLMNKKFDIAIVGAGPAGMAAALSAFNEGVKSIVIIERDDKIGGILNQCIHNGFGLHRFSKELAGPEYANMDIVALKDTSVTVLKNTMVTSVNENKTVSCMNGQDGCLDIEAKAVILAMGCRERPRGALNTPGGRCSGVFTAGSAQKLINIGGYAIGKEVVILGSGDIGLIMARRMTLEGAHVKGVFEIMPYSNGLKRNIVQCLDDYNIPLKTSCTVTEIHGDRRLEGVVVADVDENLLPIEKTKQYIKCDTLLLSVGLIPENELTMGAGITIDKRTKGAQVNQYRQTSVKGIFACGNVLHVHDLVDYVSEESFTAGKAAALYIKGKTFDENDITVINKDEISYTVPQYVNTHQMHEDIRFYMRVKSVVENKTVVALLNGEEIAHKKQNKFLPGEMIDITVPKDKLDAKTGILEFCTIDNA